MHDQDITTPAPAHPAELRFLALRDAPSDSLRAGDLIVWRRDRPKDRRVVIERPTTLHSGRLDRLAIEGALGVLGHPFPVARAAMIAALLDDQRAEQVQVA